jgi:hypothetical protein
MRERHGVRVDARGKIERRIVYNLLCYLVANGWALHGVFDGDDFTACADAQGAMELIFNLDEVSLRVGRDGGNEHGVLLVLGNGEDVLSDWSYTQGDADGFGALMDAFEVLDYV